MASEEVNARWQDSMAEYFDNVPADTAMEELAVVFHLD
jgi:L-rhamnose mutarotase